MLVRNAGGMLVRSHTDGYRLRLLRAIKGNPSAVSVEELSDKSEWIRTSRLNVRKSTLKDERGGLQNFLYLWMGLPRVPVMTNRGEEGDVYLENLAPLFFIDQSEGWTDIQALQVHRYGLQQIAQVAVEVLLGANEALKDRFTRDRAAARALTLKGAAAEVGQRVATIFGRQGWPYELSAHGSLEEIRKRWSQVQLLDVARKDFRFDAAEEVKRLEQREELLRGVLSQGVLDPLDMGAASDASQRVLELKGERHSLREELRTARTQAEEQQRLAESLGHRIHSARDVLRLKVEGIGRFEVVDCPTCHRTLEPSTFTLTAQTRASVEAHIDALERDKRLVSANAESSLAHATRLAAELERVEDKLRTSERALAAVNAAAGAVREQLAKAAMDLAAIDRDMARNATLVAELRAAQDEIDGFVGEAEASEEPEEISGDLARRRTVFESTLRTLLLALGHSALAVDPEGRVHLDHAYVPYLRSRRLRSLGSASDQPRLVAAYTLALAEASRRLQGPHPGVVVLDEPLQQNPDREHRQLFVKFLASDAAKMLGYQTIVFTWLQDPEAQSLVEAGVRMVRPEGDHFLGLIPYVEGWSE